MNTKIKQQIGIDRDNEMFEELGISFGTALIVLLALYFIIKWAVKNGIKEAYRDITGKVTTEDIDDYSRSPAHSGRSSAQADRVSAHL